MNEGKRFEDCFKKSVDETAYFIRLHDSSPAGYGGQDTMRFSMQSPYDCIIFKNHKMYALELKSTKGKSISFDGSSPKIKPHQIKELTRASKKGVNAGLVFNFREQETYFVPIEKFNQFTEETSKKSINIKEVEQIGILIPKRKLKVNYRYDLSVFVE